MGYWTVEFEGRAVSVLDGSHSAAAADAYGPMKEFLAGVHEGDGKPIYDGRSPYHPFIRPATLAEIKIFEVRHRQLAKEEAEMMGGLVDMPEHWLRGCRSCALIQVFDPPEDGQVGF